MQDIIQDTSMNQLEQIIKEHICRFNDEPQVCECFVAGVKAGQDSIDKKIISQLAYDAGYKAGQEAERTKNNLCKHGIQGNCLACYNEYNKL